MAVSVGGIVHGGRVLYSLRVVVLVVVRILCCVSPSPPLCRSFRRLRRRMRKFHGFIAFVRGWYSKSWAVFSTPVPHASPSTAGIVLLLTHVIRQRMLLITCGLLASCNPLLLALRLSRGFKRVRPSTLLGPWLATTSCLVARRRNICSRPSWSRSPTTAARTRSYSLRQHTQHVVRR